MLSDEVEFLDEIPENLKSHNFWNVLMVDDDKEVHTFSKIALKNFSFEGKKIQIFSAYTEDDARYLLSNHDFAVVFLDVMMENDDSGLRLAHYIRNDLQNKYTQLIIRTGEPNRSTETDIFKNYQVNAYCEKTHLTRDKLFAQLHASLSHYSQIIKLLEKQDALSIDNSKDYLTGLYNRKKMEEEIELLISRFNRYGECFSIIMFDIDFFKTINDTYGHQTGDEILIQLANLIQSSIRESDILIRWGGEEFIILLPFLAINQALDKAEKLRKQIQTTDFKISESVTCSFGVVEYVKGEDKKDSFSRVDKALYKAKENGRNRVEKEI